jgi:hypothetical protein
MKRQDIITKLINEGFSQKTLINLNDKQLHMLAERILSEQYAVTSNTPSVLNIPKEKTQDIASAKTRKQTFATYESEMKEQKLGAEKKEKSEKEKVLQRIHNKIESKMKKGDCIKSEVELLKRMKKDVPEKLEKYIKSKEKNLKKEVAEQDAKISKLPEESTQKPTTKPISNIPVVDGNNKKLKTWVNKLVESRYFTSKNEIMNLIQVKLNEQKTAPRPAEPEKEIETDPGMPDYDPDQDNPFKVQPGIKINPKASNEPETKPIVDPDIKTDNEPEEDNPFKVQPGVKINPKAKTEVSSEDAKNKIIDLMIKNL